MPHSSWLAPSWLRDQLCCICTKIGASVRSWADGTTGGGGGGGIAARAAPQPLPVGAPETTGGAAGGGGGGGENTGAAAGAAAEPLMGCARCVSSIARVARVGSGGRFGVGRVSPSDGGRCDGNIGSCGCALCGCGVGSRPGAGAVGGSGAR